MDYIRQLAPDPIARKVKIADLRDNLDTSRIPNPTEHDVDRWKKYITALAYLLSYKQ